MIKKCRTCGKIVDVLWPDQWAYYGKTVSGGSREFFCSWKCLRKEEERKEMAKRGRPAKKPAEEKTESVPAPKAGGEWEKAGEPVTDVKLVYDPAIAEEYLKEQAAKRAPLEVAAVYSKAMDGYQYRKTKDGMVLCVVSNNTLDMHTTTMILDWDEWKAFSAEIMQALEQLGDHG